MTPSRLSLKRSLLLSTFLALSSFSAVGLAQDSKSTTQATTRNARTTAVTTGAAATTTEKGKTTTLPSQQTTNSPETTSAAPTDLPGLSSSTTTAATGTQGKLTDLPTLSKTVDNSVPTYPAPSPPPVGNAPFMNRSTLPDGTVFIAVGSILGLFAIAILLWRGIVSFLLKRSVEKAAMAQHTTNDKAATFPAPPAPFYKDYSNLDSNPSLATPAASGRGQRRTTRGPVPSTTPSMTNLFFSPTAAGGASGGGMAANRESRFLPSGFYAATTASPANQGHANSISLSNLAPGNRASRVGQTPPESPNLMPRSTPPGVGPAGHNYSQSSLSLNRPPSGRAPSAYLDDMLDDRPEAFPPQGMTPQQQGGGPYRNYSGQQPRL